MKLLSKLQNQPEHIRKAIFWLVVILISISLSIKIIKDFQKGLKNFRGEGFKETAQMPSLKEQLKGLPKIEILKAEIENLKNLLEKINLEEKIR